MTEPGDLQAPPPPGGTSSRPGNPWERRDELGTGAALWETIKLFASSPREGFRLTRERGDYLSPLLFAIVIGWVGVIASQVWGLLFGTAAWLPSGYQDQLGFMMATSIGSTLVMIALAPIYIAVALFIAAGVVHLCVMVVGGLSESRAGFEGTFRVLAYATVANLANFLPLVGGLVATIWMLVLGIVGITSLHHTSEGKAVAAMLVPMVLCCLCLMLAFGAGLASMLGLAS